jgi:putative transposase
VLAFVRWCTGRGTGVHAAARHLGMRAATLYAWRRRWKRDRLRSARRGRPARSGTAREREAARRCLEERGPHMSAIELWRRPPGLSRREAGKLLADHRQRYRRTHTRLMHRLTWHRWGAVWATDFTQAPCPVGGVGRKLLVVRDMAGKEALAVHAVSGERAGAVLPVLGEQFRQHGAPLVLKMDNGSAFISRALLAFLDEHGVAALYSPPRTPEYNGTCEAGHTWIKTDAAWSAWRDGHADAWTRDDLQQALERSRDRAAIREGSRPLDRVPITSEERLAFQVELGRARERWAERLGLDPYDDLQRSDRAKVDRKAIPQTLETLYYLTVNRRRVRPPIRSHFSR